MEHNPGIQLSRSGWRICAFRVPDTGPKFQLLMVMVFLYLSFVFFFLSCPQAEKNAFVVADLGTLLQQHVLWQSTLPLVRPFYPVKCNSSPAVIEILAALGVGFVCANRVTLSCFTSSHFCMIRNKCCSSHSSPPPPSLPNLSGRSLNGTQPWRFSWEHHPVWCLQTAVTHQTCCQERCQLPGVR